MLVAIKVCKYELKITYVPEKFVFREVENLGRGGALVDSKPFDRRIMGLNPALAATWGPWVSP